MILRTSFVTPLTFQIWGNMIQVPTKIDFFTSTSTERYKKIQSRFNLRHSPQSSSTVSTNVQILRMKQTAVPICIRLVEPCCHNIQNDMLKEICQQNIYLQHRSEDTHVTLWLTSSCWTQGNNEEVMSNNKKFRNPTLPCQPTYRFPVLPAAQHELEGIRYVNPLLLLLISLQCWEPCLGAPKKSWTGNRKTLTHISSISIGLQWLHSEDIWFNSLQQLQLKLLGMSLVRKARIMSSPISSLVHAGLNTVIDLTPETFSLFSSLSLFLLSSL